MSTISEAHIPLLFVVYEFLKLNQEVESNKEIADKLSLDENVVDTILKFLFGLEILGKEDYYYNVISLSDVLRENNIKLEERLINHRIERLFLPESLINEVYELIIEEIKFKLILLLKFSKIKNHEGIWNKQAYFYLMYQYLLKNSYKIIKQPDKKDVFFDNMDNFFIENKNFIPLQKLTQKGKVNIKFNYQKFKILFDLYNYLGLVEKEQGKNSYVLDVDRYILLYIIELILYSEQKNQIKLQTMFQKLENFIPFAYDEKITSDVNLVPFPYAYSLYLLQKENKIHMGYKDDEGRVEFHLREILDAKNNNNFFHSNLKLLELS